MAYSIITLNCEGSEIYVPMGVVANGAAARSPRLDLCIEKQREHDGANIRASADAEREKQSIMKSSSKGGLVYSTDIGRICPECRQALASCKCKTVARSSATGDGVARVSRETKGRGGKSVTVVKGLGIDPVALAALGKQLRSACGSGGTVKDGVIEVQGEHCERVIEILQGSGYSAKRAGG